MRETKRQKATFKEIYEQLALSIEDLLEHSQRHSAAARLMLEGRPVLKEYAKDVLSALSRHTGKHYCLENVGVKLVEEGINPSEIPSVLSQIRTEYEAAELGLTGLAQGTSQHKVMTAKTERIAALHEALRSVAGDEAMALVVQTLS